MGKINVLDYEIANLIAAGEVVERPSSVLKELIENSIDAGADKIVCEIKRGGVSLIRVTDNGCGMEASDLPIALQRHATSKIKEAEDLDGITTLGFRGEALAAISSVSEITIITKTKDAANGSMLIAEAGKVVDISEVGTSDGTTIVVENLFYNVPARRKFLKRDAAETASAVAMVERIALSCPNVSIQMLIDGEEKFCTTGDGDILNTVRSVYGVDFAKKLISVSGSANGVVVSGYIGNSDNVRKNRNLEHTFINGRYVKSNTVSCAVEKAFTSYIAPECFPVFVLYLDMNPKAIDVNVHPTKLEVKFAAEQPVFETVFYSVKTAVEHQAYRPELNLDVARYKASRSAGAFVPIGENTAGDQIEMALSAGRVPQPDRYYPEPPPEAKNSMSDPEGRKAPVFDPVTITAPEGVKDVVPEVPVEQYENLDITFPLSSDATERMLKARGRPSKRKKVELHSSRKSNDLIIRRITDTPSEQFDAELRKQIEMSIQDEDARMRRGRTKNYRVIGEAYRCYIFVEYEGEMLVIDKHAAHERVLFEELKRQVNASGGYYVSQVISPEIPLELTSDEIACALTNRNELSAIGFECVIYDNKLYLKGMPDGLDEKYAVTLFYQMLANIIDGIGNPEITERLRREKMLYQIACKAAIKGGRRYDDSVTEWIVERVLSNSTLTVCPHGRPLVFKLTKRELDRQFDRIK